MTVSGRVVYLNGQYVPEDQARISIYDSGLLMGAMAFEVTRTCAGRPYRLEAHLGRLLRTLAALHIESGLELEGLTAITREVLNRNLPTAGGDVDWNIIHNISAGISAAFPAAEPADRRPTVAISCYPLFNKLADLAPAYENGLDLVVPTQRSLPGAVLDPSIKTRSRLHYHLANVQAAVLRPGAWAALVDPDGFLTEATSGNLFVVARGELLTPFARNLLPGVTRSVLCELAGGLGLPWREADMTVVEAVRADEMFLTSTSVGILHARSLEGHVFGDSTPGPITRRLRAALSREMGLDIAEQARAYRARRDAGA